MRHRSEIRGLESGKEQNLSHQWCMPSDQGRFAAFPAKPFRVFGGGVPISWLCRQMGPSERKDACVV